MSDPGIQHEDRLPSPILFGTSSRSLTIIVSDKFIPFKIARSSISNPWLISKLRQMLMKKEIRTGLTIGTPRKNAREPKVHRMQPHQQRSNSFSPQKKIINFFSDSIGKGKVLVSQFSYVCLERLQHYITAPTLQ